MGKSGIDERLFEEQRKNLKYKKGNRVYTIHREDYRRKSYPNPQINPGFYANPRRGDVRHVTILILCLIFPPQQT